MSLLYVVKRESRLFVYVIFAVGCVLSTNKKLVKTGKLVDTAGSPVGLVSYIFIRIESPIARDAASYPANWLPARSDELTLINHAYPS